jgi:hypothetical protein
MISTLKTSCLLTVLLGWHLAIHGQNMVLNPSFETNTGCPSGLGQINLASNWFRMPSHPGNPDYLHVCSTNANFSVPTNFNGTQTPSTGNAYAGMVLYYGTLANFREYIETQLTSPMVAGQAYLIELKASLAENCAYTTPSFQFRFTNSVYSCISPYCNGYVPTGPLATFPTVTSPTLVTDKLNWTTVSAVYTAVGGEQFMTFGNFQNDASTPIFPTGSGSLIGSFYYVDDVSVTPLNIGMPVDLVEYSVSCTNEIVHMNWACASQVNNDYFSVQTSEDGVNFSTVAVIDGAGNSNALQHYESTVPRNASADKYIRLTQTDFNGETKVFSTQSIACEVSDKCPDVIQQNGQLVLSVYSEAHQPIHSTLYSSDGKLTGDFMHTLIPGTNAITLEMPHMDHGLYFIHMDAANMHCTSKLLFAPN